MISDDKPSGFIEIPETLTEAEFAKFREAWIKATSEPHRLAILSYEWGVRVGWADKSIKPHDDIPYPSRAEAEEEVALDPQWRTLIRRTVVQRVPERGEWHPAADLATYVPTAHGFAPVTDQPTEGEPS